MTADLTPAERATVDRFDAAVPAPESLRERVAEALWTNALEPSHYGRTPWEHLHTSTRRAYLRFADAAIAVITGGAA